MNTRNGRLLGLLASAAITASMSARADVSTWTGATNNAWNNAGNWSATPAFDAGSVLYFANYASGAASRSVLVNTTGGTVGAFVFGSETSGAGNALSVIGARANSTTLAGVTGSTLGLTGDLAAASVGLWVKPGAGADGIYFNNSGSPSLTQNGPTLAIGSALTLVNDSDQPFILNARLVDGASAGSLVLQNGKWTTNYNISATAAANFNTLSGGVTIENATWTVDVAATVTPDSANSVLGKGTITLGKDGSSSDAVFALGGLGHSTRSRIAVSANNFIEVSAGSGQRIIRNLNALPKQLYSRIDLNGSATLALDNNSVSGGSFELSASNGNGVGNDSDLQTGVRGTGNLYLTGGGTFFTNAGVDVPANGPRNSFTGTTTVHQGTLRFDLAGGFFKTARFQVDKDGILKANTTAAYTIGDPAYLGAGTQTLAGTGQVQGAILLGAQSILRPGGADEPGRSALSFDSDLALGPLTIIDFASGYYGALDGAGRQLTLGGELRLTLVDGFQLAGTSYSLLSFGSLVNDFGQVTIYENGVHVGDFVPNGILWTGQISGYNYAFNPTTGNLTAVPEPGTAALGAAVALFVGARLRKRISSSARNRKQS